MRKIIGHTLPDLLARVYSHKEIEDLIEAIDKS